jgi:hypothetical protein
MKRKTLVAVGVSILLVLAVAGAAFAQGATPPAKSRGVLPNKIAELRGAFPFGGGGWKVYDAVAEALKLTPTQLFEQLHSGKTLQEIAKAQGVEMQAIGDAAKAVRQTQAREAIQKALENGKITKEQADWMLKGLENGWRASRLPFGMRPARPVK